jgi:hypothetical protein
VYLNSSTFTRGSFGAFGIAVVVFTAARMAAFVDPSLSIPFMREVPHTGAHRSTAHQADAQNQVSKGAGIRLVVGSPNAGVQTGAAPHLSIVAPAALVAGMGPASHVVTRAPGGVAVAPVQDPVAEPADAPGVYEAPDPASGGTDGPGSGGAQAPERPVPVVTSPVAAPPNPPTEPITPVTPPAPTTEPTEPRTSPTDGGHDQSEDAETSRGRDGGSESTAAERTTEQSGRDSDSHEGHNH